jgi:preprotein translocase subunit SecG
MILLITILIILASVALGFFVLVQNPKGGGLSGAFGSIGSQVMGVKQSTDIMEKGTWTLISIIAGLSIISVMFFEKPKDLNEKPGKQQTQQQAPQQKGK